MIAFFLGFFLLTAGLSLFSLAFRFGWISALYFKRAIQISFILLFVLPLLQLRSDSQPLFQVEMQKWIPLANALEISTVPKMLVPPAGGNTSFQQGSWALPSLGDVLFGLCLLGVCIFFLRLVFERFRTQKLQRQSLRVRSHAKVDIYLSAQIKSAFCLGLFRKSIYLPTNHYFVPLQRSVVLAHEFSHLQSQDPFWTLCMELVRHCFFCTGLGFSWRKWYLLVSEVECDQRTTRRLGMKSKDYFHLLINHLSVQTAPFGSTGVSLSYQHMKRRIQMHHKLKTKAISGIFLGLILVSGVAVSAAVNYAKITGVKWTVEDVRKVMADKNPAVPVIYHKKVAKELTLFLSSADTKRKLRKAFSRLKVYESNFREQMTQANLPVDYVLLPLIESAYQNIEGVGNRSGGLWQFIPETARKYGLIVDDNLDERFDIPKATSAAIQYLQKLNGIFKDPQLALLAYNMGERALLQQMQDTGADTVEELLDKGNLSKENRNHATRFQAALILYYNPQLL